MRSRNPPRVQLACADVHRRRWAMLTLLLLILGSALGRCDPAGAPRVSDPRTDFASRFDQTPGTMANPGRWKRPPDNPIFHPGGPAWRCRWTANPDLLRRGDTYSLYYRGNNGTCDQIGVATIP